MSVPDADTLIRLAEILEVSVSELLGTKIENENVASDVAEQLSRINEQLAIKNRRSRRIWKIVAIILAVIVLVNIFIALIFTMHCRRMLQSEKLQQPDSSSQLHAASQFYLQIILSQGLTMTVRSFSKEC